MLPNGAVTPERPVESTSSGLSWNKPTQQWRRVTDIDWIEADANYARLQVGEKSHLIRETMKGLESKLNDQQFVRVHRSVIIAIERIQSIEAREQGEHLITMPGGHRFVSSRGYSERVRALLR